jgi:hypothetical protein
VPWLLVLSGLLVLPGSVGESLAQSRALTLGLRSWYSNWTFEQPADADWDVDPSLLVGPTATFRLGKFSVGASYLFGTFGSVYSMAEGDFNVDLKRRDLDLVVGYRFQRYFNATLGYKRFTYAAQFEGEDLAEVDSNGFGGGITFSRSFDAGLVLSGSANLMRMSTKIGDADKVNHLGYNAEANLGYRIRPHLPIPLVGYRIQSISGDYEDRFSGFTFSVLYQL